MKITKLKFDLLAVILAFFIVSGLFTNSYAQKEHKKGKLEAGEYAAWLEPCKDIPDLTDEQQKKIKELKIEKLKAMNPLKSQLKIKNTHLKSLMIAKKADMEAINKTIDEILAIKGKMKKNCAAFKQNIRKILTTDQRAVFDAKILAYPH